MKNENERFEDIFDKILRWYKSDGTKPLAPDLAQRLLRWKSAQTYILTFRPLTSTEVVNYLTKTFTISEPVAWRDLRDTKRLFAEMDTVNDSFDRIMMAAEIRDTKAKALAAGKFAAAAQCDTNMIKLRGFEKDPGEAQSGSKQIILNLQFNPKLVGAKEIPNLLQTVEKFIGEKAKRELMIEDIDFDEISDTKAAPDGK
jgi:hypothetical protein